MSSYLAMIQQARQNLGQLQQAQTDPAARAALQQTVTAPGWARSQGQAIARGSGPQLGLKRAVAALPAMGSQEQLDRLNAWLPPEMRQTIDQARAGGQDPAAFGKKMGGMIAQATGPVAGLKRGLHQASQIAQQDPRYAYLDTLRGGVTPAQQALMQAGQTARSQALGAAGQMSAALPPGVAQAMAAQQAARVQGDSQQQLAMLRAQEMAQAGQMAMNQGLTQYQQEAQAANAAFQQQQREYAARMAQRSQLVGLPFQLGGMALGGYLGGGAGAQAGGQIGGTAGQIFGPGSL